MNTLGLAALGGALWWLSRLNRNPDGAGFRDKSGRFHPIRSSEWYQPSLLDAPETTRPPQTAVPPQTAPPAEEARTRSGARAKPTARALSGPSWKPSSYYSDVWRKEYPSDQYNTEGVRVLVQRANVETAQNIQYVAWYSVRIVHSGKVEKDFGSSWGGEVYEPTKALAIEEAKKLARQQGGQLVRKADESAAVRSRRERLSGADVKRAEALQAGREAAKPSGSSSATARAERLRALEAKRREEVAAQSSSVRFHLQEAAMAGGGVMTARRRSGLRTRDRQIRKSFALSDEADSFARRAAYQEARARDLAASEAKVAGGLLTVGSRVHLWYTWGYGQYEGTGTIVKRLKNGWSVKLEQSRISGVPSPNFPRPKLGDWVAWSTNRTPITYPAAGDKGYTADRPKYPRTGIDGVYVDDRLLPVTM